MQNKVPRESYRLIMILTYIALTWPDHVRIIYYMIFSTKAGWNYLVLPITFILYILLELYEFLKLRYNQNRDMNMLILYMIRLTPLVISLFLLEKGKFFPWFTGLILPLIVFYTYFVIPRRAGLVLLTTVILWIFFSDASMLESLSSEKAVYTMIETTYKALSVLFFYFFAWFWEKDRIRYNERTALLEELREYAGKAAENAVLEERTRLARDLHDTLGHAMTVIQIQLARAEAYYGKEENTSRGSLRTAKETAKDAMEDIRDSLSGLNSRSELLDLKNSLPPLLKPLESTGCLVKYNLEGSQRDYNYSVLMTAYRMVQEGVTNILKHADAKEASLNVEMRKEELRICLADKGIGFVFDNEDSHFGLSGLRRRLELVRGVLEITTAPGEGTILSARIPRDPLSLMEEP